ncbi:MAG: DUF5996 family protein [Bacteroidota bacterium]
MGNKLENVRGFDLELMKSTREQLHQAVQLVSAVPRSYLPHDPSDELASLSWHEEREALESKQVAGFVFSLSLKEMYVSILNNDQEFEALALEGKSVNQGLRWLKEHVNKFGLAEEQLHLKLPYEIGIDNFDTSLKFHTETQQELSNLYAGAKAILDQVVKENMEASAIRCWPHHFDIATLIPLQENENGEVTSSLGVGFSPGDQVISQPYFYVNIWPDSLLSDLNKHDLWAGHWNDTEWSGAVLHYQDLLKASDVTKTVQHFISTTISRFRNSR